MERQYICRSSADADSDLRLWSAIESYSKDYNYDFVRVILSGAKPFDVYELRVIHEFGYARLGKFVVGLDGKISQRGILL